MAGPNVPVAHRLIPRPDVPVRPLLSLSAFLAAGPPDVPCVLDSGHVAYASSGRMAIALALKKMDLRKGDKVLIPAFHCTSMVEPLSVQGAVPKFYRIKRDLSVDLDDIVKKIDGQTRVLMVAHYFGFPQDMPSLRDFCDAQGLLLLEDCAHAFFGTCGGRPVGALSDFAVASLWKFFPIHDGGGLVSPKTPIDDLKLRSQGSGADARSGIRQITAAIGYGRLSILRPILAALRGTRNVIRSIAPKEPPGRLDAQRAAGASHLGSGAGGEFDAASIDVRMTTTSRLIFRAVSKQRIIRAHRRNFLLLLDGLSGLPGVHPLFGTLPDGVVPFEFPLWLDDLERIFPMLEDLAVPMHRFGQFLWPEMEESECATAAALSHHLLQLPCHESLTPTEIQSIIDRVRDVARR